jgi:RimJ/RimL family protein N-acetyltransferase
MKDVFRGELVRFTFEEPDVISKSEVRWQRDSEFVRLADNTPRSFISEKRARDQYNERLEKEIESERYMFSVRTLAEDKLIGFLSLWIDLIHSVAWVGLGIGERDLWNQGYGTDMMNICLRYSFLELGLQRVSLGLHGYNTRALRTYEKVGFRLEGCTRKEVLREGKRSDTLWMGILREEWLQMQNGNPT